MAYNPYEIVRSFEQQMAQYTGSTYAVAVDSCTNAIFLCCKYLQVADVCMPSKTYLSVPMSVMHAGGKAIFDQSPETNSWTGMYQLKPYPVYDAARRLTSKMYIPDSYMCLSFQAKKHLPIGKGGMILTDDADATAWFKRARYEGRNEIYYKEDNISELGWNMYMTPEQAARGLTLLQNYPEHNPDIEEKNGYRELTEFDVFEDCEVINSEN